MGRQLNDLVFGVPDVAALFQQTRGVAASRGAQVLLRLLVAPQSLGEWPWEMLVDPQRPDQFLTMARDVHVVRAGRARTYAVRSEPVEPPLNLLMVLSSPLTSGSGADETPFDLYEEKRALLAELEPLEDRGLLRIEVEDRPTMERLRARIGRQRRGFHLLHYLGHAQPNGLRLELPNRRGGLVTSASASPACCSRCPTCGSPSSPAARRPALPWTPTGSPGRDPCRSPTTACATRARWWSGCRRCCRSGPSGCSRGSSTRR